MPEPTREATLTPTTDDRGRALSDSEQAQRRVTVDFNPESLQLTLANTIEQGRGRRPAQSVAESTATLTMKLVFDTTTTGGDVRERTHPITQMMDPIQAQASRGRRQQNQKVPAIVVFEWGTLRFEGYISRYQENLEFFSAQGVPLRAAVDLAITQQERTFSPRDDVDVDISSVQGQLSLGGVQSVTDAAAAAGDPGAARRLGEQNGLENLRLPGAGAVAVGGVSLRAAASFSAGASAGIGVSGGAGLSVGGGASAQAGASAGGTASLFAGLRTPSASQRPRDQLQTSVQAPVGTSLGIGRETNFTVGGQPAASGSDSLSADVGLRADLGALIRFGGK